MAQSHRQWLATKVLSDQQTVTYRVLARALKVHVNEAKKMLYDFHQHENTKKEASVHATYLVCGLKRLEGSNKLANGHSGGEAHDADSPIPSSPPPFTSSMLDPDDAPKEEQLVQTISLVREESLQAVKAFFNSISCVHVYSLSPNRLSDLQTLNDSGREVFNTYFSAEDPLEHNGTYGVILNPNVRRRTARRPPSRAAPAPPKPAASLKKPAQQQPSKSAAVKSEAPSSRPSSAGSSTPSTTSKPSLKRDTSDIFRAFAKNKAKAKPTSTTAPASVGPAKGTGSSTPSTTSRPLSRASKHLASDSEGASDPPSPDSTTAGKKRSSTSGRADRAAKLRKMMDDDNEEEVKPLTKKEDVDETMTDAPAETPKSNDDEDEEEVEWSESDHETVPPKPKVEEPAAAAAAAVEAQPANQRRGRRKVTKKVTTMDEEGYLVTKEEVGWESFSEGEGGGVVKKVVVGGVGKGAKGEEKGGGKAKIKEAGKATGTGKKDIASFFKKK